MKTKPNQSAFAGTGELLMHRRGVLSGAAAAAILTALPKGARAQTGAQAGAPPEVPAEPTQLYLDARAALLQGRKTQTGRIQLEIPRISENGTSVPMRFVVQSPQTQDDHVKFVHILSEQNPIALIARFHFGPGSLTPDISTNIRLATTQIVHAIAEMGDGSLFEGTAETVVALAACLDES